MSSLGGVSVVSVAGGKLLAFVPITRIFPDATDINAGPIALNNSGTAAPVVNSASPERGTVAVLSTRTLRVRSRIRVVTDPDRPGYRPLCRRFRVTSPGGCEFGASTGVAGTVPRRNMRAWPL